LLPFCSLDSKKHVPQHSGMQNNSDSGGRPTFRIDPKRLREIRRANQLTQAELAERVYAKLGKASASLDVMKSSYQRWERFGAMTPEAARHLAAALGTTVGVLQGAAPEAPPDRVNQIEGHLKELAAQQVRPVNEALAKYADSAQPLRSLAISVCSRLEAAQLSQDHRELSDLAALTGWSLEELQRPMSVHGYWLLVGTGSLAPRRTEVLHGVSELLYEIRQELAATLQMHESDAQVSFHEAAPWFRIEIQHPRFRQLTRTLRFVRCQPTETGLQWAQASWWDRFWLDELPEDAHDHANFVADFGASAPQPEDLSRLRLAILKVPAWREVEVHGSELPPDIIGVAKLGSEDPPEWVRERFTPDGTAHDLYTNWLASEVWELLSPLLQEWPCEYWRLSHAAGRVEVRLEAPAYLIAKRGGEYRHGPLYNIVLLEEQPSGTLKSAPWRRSSVAAVREKLEKLLERAREEATAGSPPARL
jgi:transcriptional regulator with XRE-family HTH domain